MAWFFVYLSGDVVVAEKLKMANASDIRYTGWSVNANQLALFLYRYPCGLLRFGAMWCSQADGK